MFLMAENIRSLVRCHRYRRRSDRLQIDTIMRMNIRGATAIDIGANKGAYCYWLSKAVGENGLVVAFEPQPELKRIIEAQQAAFCKSKFKVVPIALSNRDGVNFMSRRLVGDKSASLSAPCSEGALSVETHQLDSLKSPSIANLKFIKCDVEGNEYNTLLGAKKTIVRHSPVIQVEISITKKTSPLKKFFSDLGYHCAMYDKSSLVGPVWESADPLTRDFLAFKIQHLGRELDQKTTRVLNSLLAQPTLSHPR